MKGNRQNAKGNVKKQIHKLPCQNMKIKKIIVALSCMIIAITGWYYWQISRIPEDMGKLYFLNYAKNPMEIHMLSWQENRSLSKIQELPVRVHLGSANRIRKEGDYVLAKRYQNIGFIISDINVLTGESKDLLHYKQILKVKSDCHMIQGIKNVPDSNGISILCDNLLYYYDKQTKDLRKLCEISAINSSLDKFFYEWKTKDEIYHIENENLILHNLKTGNKETALADVGNSYFYMSNDKTKILYTSSCDKGKRTIYLGDIETGEKKEIGSTQSDYEIKAYFSPDDKYIAIDDYHGDPKVGKSYYYIYEIAKEKMKRMYFNDQRYLLIGW